jgi:carbamoyl-phosphate synthase large subunit
MLVSDPLSADVKILLTGAGGSASANVLDSLRRSASNYWVLGADISHTRLHLSEAYERCLIPQANNSGYIQSVNTALSEFGVDVLHVQPDPELRVVSQHRNEIRASLFLPSNEAIQLASDKSRFADAMLTAGVPIPESVSFESRTQIHEKVGDLLKRHERVWVRARVGAGAKASLPVSTAQQAMNWIDWWTEEKDMTVQQFMASEMLPGSEFAFQSVWQDGNLIVGQARERLEYLYGFLAPSGQSSTPAIARTVSSTNVTELATKAIRALDSHPNGVYCVDIKCTQNGSPRVTEINAGRFFTTSNFFAAAGLNMPDMVMKAATGTRLSPIGLSPLDDDLYWIRNVDMNYVLVSESELNKWKRF